MSTKGKREGKNLTTKEQIYELRKMVLHLDAQCAKNLEAIQDTRKNLKLVINAITAGKESEDEAKDAVEE